MQLQRAIVEAVAAELGRRGVIAWLYENDLESGVSIGEVLKRSIQRQETLTLFLSPASVASRWVEEEVIAALQTFDELGDRERIIPVYLGDPLSLVSSHPVLRTRWLHADGDRVDKLGILADPADSVSDLAVRIAIGVARRIYSALKMEERRDVLIYLDERGKGQRSGEPKDIPDRVKQLDAAALVFRNDLGIRQEGETLHGEQWEKMCASMQSALAMALGTPRWADAKNIRIIGNAQLGMPFFLGMYFNRNTAAELFCYNMNGQVLTNYGQQRHTPLQGGNPNCNSPHPNIAPTTVGQTTETISLILSPEYYVAAVLDYLTAHSDSPPPVWVQTGIYDTSKQAMGLVADVVALLTRLRHEHGVRFIELYCGLPFHLVPLLAANLLHVIERVTFMEYRRDLQGTNSSSSEMYVPLKMLT